MPDAPRPGSEHLTQRMSAESDLAGLRMRVTGPNGVVTVALPPSGVLVVGRGEEADVQVEDASVSRRHARIHVGQTLQIEDLDSANGTRVRGQTVSPGARVDLHPGDVVEFGAALCTVLGASGDSASRPLRTHAYFEARLEDECARAADTHAGFALLRLHVEGGTDVAFEAGLLAFVRPVDVVAAYGPGEYEVLVPGASASEAAGMATMLRARLSQGGRRLRTGVATCPRDGRSPQTLIARACAAVLPQPEAAEPPSAQVVIEDPAMQLLRELVARVAAGDIHVLLLGETGVGKEIFAELVHQLSPRATKALVRLNCAAFSDTLVESELFGYEKGAFTGALQTRAGLLESAQGGTVFLDEVGELSLGVQAKLLRVLEAGEVRRVGALRSTPIDVRFVAATNRDLEAEVATGRFRADLFFRLNGFTLRIPPLRERPAEIEPLARRFADRARRRLGFGHSTTFTAAALAQLARFRWPGNIRELRNVIERAVLLAGEHPIAPEHLPAEKLGTEGASATTVPPPPPASARPSAPRPSMPPTEPASPTDPDDSDTERQRVIAALDECAGNQTRAAQRLGITRRQLIARLERYGLPRPRK